MSLEKVCVVLEGQKLTRGIFAVQLIVLKSAAKSLDHDAQFRTLDTSEELLLYLGCSSVYYLEKSRAVQVGRFPKKNAKLQNVQIFSTRYRIQAMR